MLYLYLVFCLNSLKINQSNICEGKLDVDKSVDKLWHVWKYMRTMETTRYTDPCLPLTSFRLKVLGDLQEKWMSFAIMLQTYLVKDNTSKRSGGRSRSCESTINWTTWSVATLRVAIVALHQPVEIETWLLQHSHLPNLMQTSFRANHEWEQYREANSGKQISRELSWGTTKPPQWLN